MRRSPDIRAPFTEKQWGPIGPQNLMRLSLARAQHDGPVWICSALSGSFLVPQTLRRAGSCNGSCRFTGVSGIEQTGTREMLKRQTVVLLLLVLVAGCAALESLREVLQAPRFSQASGRQTELRLLGPSSQRPLGGAAVRIWTRVENPNSLGLTLSRVAGNLYLEGTRAADVNLPLGLPLRAQQDTVIPLDIAFSFSDLPELADVAARLLTRSSVGYRMEGTLTLDAGAFGQPSFGPSTLLQGDVPIRR